MPRYLGFNHGSETPLCVAAIYAEPDRGEEKQGGRLKIAKAKRIAAYYARMEDGEWGRADGATFAPGLDVWRWLANKARKRSVLWVFGCELSVQAELTGIWQALEGGLINCWRPRTGSEDNSKRRSYEGWLSSGSLPFVLRGLIRGKRIDVVDIRNYTPAPIDQLPGPSTLGRLTASTMPNSEDMIHAGAVIPALCVISWAMTTFSEWRDCDIGTWQPTAAKLAMRAYQHHVYNNHKVADEADALSSARDDRRVRIPRIVFHDDKDVRALERAAYFGGEAQAFRIGRIEERCHYVDVRACYPWIASTIAMPYSLHSKFGPVNTDWLLTQTGSLGAVAVVRIGGAGSEYPLRLARGERVHTLPSNIDPSRFYEGCERRVIYPEGAYETVLCGEELEDALRRGLATDVLGGALYRVGELFGTFMRTWWTRRRRAERAKDDAAAGLCKLVMNGLLGKFGQMGQSWQAAPEVDSPLPWGEWYVIDATAAKVGRYRSMGWHVQRLAGREECSSSFPAIPAFVCSAARYFMRFLRRKCPRGSVVLQDTDCLIVTDEGLSALEQDREAWGNEMGRLHVKDTAWGMHVLGPRHYRFGEKVVMAGVKAGFKDVSPGAYQVVVTDWLMGRYLGRPHGEALQRLETIHVAPEMLGRWVNSDGTTEPIAVGF